MYDRIHYKLKNKLKKNNKNKLKKKKKKYAAPEVRTASVLARGGIPTLCGGLTLSPNKRVTGLFQKIPTMTCPLTSHRDVIS